MLDEIWTKCEVSWSEILTASIWNQILLVLTSCALKSPTNCNSKAEGIAALLCFFQAVKNLTEPSTDFKGIASRTIFGTWLAGHIDLSNTMRVEARWACILLGCATTPYNIYQKSMVVILNPAPVEAF